MKYIGKKISVVEKEGEVSIVILASAEKSKANLLFAWLIAWTVCGLAVIIHLFSITNNNLKAYLIGWLAFWAYFEYKIVKVYLWRRSGLEKIKIKDETLFIKREIASKGKIEPYRADFIKDLRLIQIDNNFIKTISESYWVIGGESLAFEYYGKTVKFGLQLSKEEGLKLLKLLTYKLKLS